MVAYRCQYIRCGKANCKACPHGPYWYSFYRVNGKMKSEYHGKADPRIQQERDKPANRVDPLDAIFNRSTVSIDLACQILGLPAIREREDSKKRYLHLVRLHHPDVGGDVATFQRIEAAWSFVKSYYGWGK